jgi:hypothetical protein
VNASCSWKCKDIQNELDALVDILESVHFIVARRARHSGLMRAARRLFCFSPLTELFLVDGTEESLSWWMLTAGLDLALVEEAADLVGSVEKNMLEISCCCWMRNMKCRWVKKSSKEVERVSMLRVVLMFGLK